MFLFVLDCLLHFLFYDFERYDSFFVTNMPSLDKICCVTNIQIKHPTN